MFDAGLRRPLPIHVRIYAGRPWTTDNGLRLASGATWPNPPVYHFPGGITWTTTLGHNDPGFAVGTATRAQVDALNAISERGPVQISDPVTGRVWGAGEYDILPTNWTGGAALTPFTTGATIINDAVVVTAIPGIAIAPDGVPYLTGAR